MSTLIAKRAKHRVPLKIGHWELAFLLTTMAAGQESTVFNSIMTPIVGRDIWLSVLLGMGLGALAVVIWSALMARFPREGIETIAAQLLGPLRWPFLVAFVVLMTVYAAIAGRTFTSLSAIIFPTTPPPMFVVPLFALAVYGGILGIQVVARVNQLLLFYVDVPAGMILSMLLMGQQRMQRILPILAHGWVPVVSGGLMMMGLYSQLAMVLIFAPATVSLQKLKGALLAAVGMIGLMAMGHNVGPVLQFGALAKQLAWPSFAQLRLIQVGRDIQRLDVFAVVLWVHGYWILVVMNLKASSLLLKRLFHFDQDHWILAGLAIAAYGLSTVVAATQDVLFREVQLLNQWIFPSLGLGFPLLLLGLAAIRGSRRKHQSARADNI